MFHSRCIWGTFYAPCTHSWLCAACLVHHYLSLFDVDRREWIAVFVLAYNASSAMHTIRYKQEVRLVSLKHARVRLVDRGALDCVIRARVETAVLRAKGE